MFTLPAPLHPVIVHFPIVLLLVGAAGAVLAVVLNRWHLPWFAAALLTLGSIGAFVASQTGETAEDQAGKLPPTADALLEVHEEAAERTEAAGAVAALLAIAAAAFGVFSLRRETGEVTASRGAAVPAVAFGLRAGAALAALIACYFVYETGHAGGKLVYEHGVGIKQTAKLPGLPVRQARATRD